MRIALKRAVLVLACALASGSCIPKSSKTLSASCASASSGNLAFFGTFGECANSTGASDCTNQVILIGTEAKTCFFSPSVSTVVQSTPASLQFLTSAIDAGTITSSTTRTFYVKNIGTQAATGCVATLESGAPSFSLASNQEVVIAPLAMIPVVVNVNFQQNGGLKTGTLKVECAQSVNLAGGTISATFGASAPPVNPILSLESTTVYSLPSLTATQLSTYQHPVVLKNTGPVQTSGCSASLVNPSDPNLLVNQGLSLINGGNFSLNALTGNRTLGITASWSSSPRTAKLRVICSSTNTNFISDTFTVPAGLVSPDLTVSFPNYSPAAFTAAQTLTLSGTATNTPTVPATNCSFSIVDEANNALGPSAGIALNSPSSPISVLAGGSTGVSVGIVWNVAQRKFKVKASCDNETSYSGIFTIPAGTPSPYLEILSVTPSNYSDYSVEAFLQAHSPQTVSVTFKNTGNANGSGCSSYLVQNNASESPLATAGITTSTDPFNLSVGATVTRDVRIDWNVNSREFKLKANCLNSNWISSNSFTVAPGAFVDLEFTPGTFSTTDSSRSVTVRNIGNTGATGCNASIFEVCPPNLPLFQSCDTQPEVIDLYGIGVNVANFTIPPNGVASFELRRPPGGNLIFNSFEETVYLKIQCGEHTESSGPYEFD